ncbi:MAG: hypothetical protein ACXVEF_27865 [Polyangiales bacterium]
MKRLVFGLFLLLGCKGANAPSEPTGTTIDGSFACKGAGDKKWKASFSSTKIDECAVKSKDQILDVRIGTLEDGLTLHIADYTGTGQYQVPGTGGSKLGVVAKGGIGESTSTSVDTSPPDPCKSTCTVDVTEAGEGALSIDVTCEKLTRIDSGACITCTPTSPTFVRAHGVSCRKE